jgi:hypothetical protein
MPACHNNNAAIAKVIARHEYPSVPENHNRIFSRSINGFQPFPSRNPPAQRFTNAENNSISKQGNYKRFELFDNFERHITSDGSRWICISTQSFVPKRFDRVEHRRLARRPDTEYKPDGD